MIQIFVGIVLLVMVSALLFSGTDESGATEALQDSGYTDIRLTGYQLFGCAQDDTYHTGFVATSVGGRRVVGVVCANWAKGRTIRLLGHN